MYKKIYHIDSLNQYFVQEPDNENTLDDIFGWLKLANREITMENNLYTGYQYPSRMRYYFSNIAEPEINQNLVVLHDNNIPISLVTRMNTLQEKRMAKAIGHNEIKFGVSGWCKEGVYVVDYYNLDFGVNKGHRDAIRYILESENVFKNNPELRMKIKSYVANKAENHVQHSRYYKYPDFKIRVVTFIPKDKIVEHMAVNVKELGIVINLGELDPNMEYPNDYTSHQEEMKIDLTPKHYVQYEIVNNEIDDFPSFVYTMNGNQVIKIPVIKDHYKRTGCYVRRSMNGITTSSDFSSLEDMEKTFGIYRTYLDAKWYGDPAKQIEMNKLELESQKVDVGFREVDLKKYEIRNKRFLATLELDRKREEWMYNISKMKFDIEGMKHKIIMEYRILMAKYSQETLKIDKSDMASYFNMALSCLKMIA